MRRALRHIVQFRQRKPVFLPNRLYDVRLYLDSDGTTANTSGVW